MINQNSGQQSDAEKGREKFRSLYPGVYVTTTVEGSYQNLRRFIREIETGNEFIIVSAIELAPSENEGQKEQRQNQVAKQQVANPATMQPGGFPPGFNPGQAEQTQNQSPRTRGKMRGETVALHIEMAAYFRRPNFTPMVPATAIMAITTGKSPTERNKLIAAVLLGVVALIALYLAFGRSLFGSIDNGKVRLRRRQNQASSHRITATA